MRVQSKSTIVTLANAAALTGAVMKELMGSQVGDSINGKKLTSVGINELSFANVRTALLRQQKAKV